jgi:hypothetical protein
MGLHRSWRTSRHSFEFDQAGQFGSGLAPARSARTGFINKAGRFAFELAFDYAPGFLTGDWENNRFAADSTFRASGRLTASSGS